MDSAALAPPSTRGPPEPDHISRRQFARLSEYIHRRCGIKLSSAKQTMVEGRLRRRLRALGVETLDAYCEYVFDNGGLDDEAVHLINALTTNKTDFFREAGHFEFLTRIALPELVVQRPRCIKAWSAACSTGAEPYSMAMVIDAFLAERGAGAYSVLASDISTDVLEVARRGVYSESTLSPTPLALRHRYVLEARDRSSQLCRIAPALRARLAFARINLIDPTYPVERDLDLLFCRNVLIYFDKATQAAVLERLCDHLRPGGYLFLGHSESIAGVALPVTQVGNTVFRRR